MKPRRIQLSRKKGWLMAWTKHTAPVSCFGLKWIYETTYRRIEIMAVCGGYAMVRRKGCTPFVVSKKQIMPDTFTPLESEIG